MISEELWILDAEKQVVFIMIDTHAKQKILIFQKVVFAESFKKGMMQLWIKQKTCFQELQVMHHKETAKQLRLNVPHIAFLTMMVIARRMGLRLMI